MGKGKQFELDIKRDIDSNTKAHAKAHRPDYSGNSAGEVADVMIVWQAERYEAQRPCGHAERHVAYAELKKRSGTEGNRTTVMSGSSSDQSGLEELRELLNETPWWTECVVGIKFPHRELIVLDAQELYMHLVEGPFPQEHGWGWHGARLTPSDNISVIMPELSEGWLSSQSGLADWKKLALSVGLEPYDFIEE